MRIYLSGPITGHEDMAEERFYNAAVNIVKRFGRRNVEIVNPFVIGRSIGEHIEFTHDEIMKVCFALMDLCDAVYFMDGWENSEGCKMEWIYAQNTMMKIIE